MNPIIIKSDFLLEIASWFNGFPVVGLSTWPFIVLEENVNRPTTLQHELIHHRQQEELLVVGQWILYGFFFLYAYARGHDHSSAYNTNPFEAEAHANENNKYYLLVRPHWAWISYIT